MSQRERLLAITIGGLLLAGLLWLAFAFNWSNEGGQFRQIGERMGERRGVQSRDYQYVGNIRTKQYWPNEEPYISNIPTADRVFILDNTALGQFHGYTAGPR